MKQSLRLLLLFLFATTIFGNNRLAGQPFTTNMFVHKTYCNTINGSAHVVPRPPSIYTYRWSTGSTTDSVFNLPVGSYTVTVYRHDSLSGAITDSLRDTAIVVRESVRLILNTFSNPTCGANNGFISVAGTGGSGSYIFHYYRFGTDRGAGTSLPVGHYILDVSDIITGCVSDSIELDLLDNGSYFRVSDTNIVNENCFRDSVGSVEVMVSGGFPPYRYRWSASADTTNILSHLTRGVYTLSISDSLCPAWRTFSFPVNGPSQALTSITSAIPDTCLRNLGSVSASAVGGTSSYTFLWSNSATTDTIGHLGAGAYYLTITDVNGCSVEDTVGIPNIGGPSAYVYRMDSTCIYEKRGLIQVKVTSRDRPHHYSWSHMPGLDTSLVYPLSAGDYTVTITNNKGCDTILRITVPVYYLTGLELFRDTSIYAGQFVKLETYTSTNVDTVRWYPPVNLVSLGLQAQVQPQTNTWYHVEVQYNNGCTLHDSVYIQVDTLLAEYRIPNIFTPNGDGLNDVFKADFNEGVNDIELHVFDRWGNKVFDSFDKNFQWIGTLQNGGFPLESGVYSYTLIVRSVLNGKAILLAGNITMLR